jgi:hypothetical protein
MSITRRDALKGLSLGAGGILLSPILKQIQAQAAGTADLPQRFVFVVEGNGLPPNQIQPLGLARAKRNEERNKVVRESLAAYDLPKAIEPLAPWKDRLTIVQGLSGKICGGGHSNNFGALGCFNSNGGVGNSGLPQGETIDAALGKRLGGIFPLVGLGISDRPEHTIIYNCSGWEKGKALPTQCRPDLAYAALFGSVAGGSAKAEFQTRTNVLDFLRDDLQRLERRVAGPERDKLQTHLAAYEALRDRQSRLNEIEHTLREQAPVVNDKYKSEVETDRLDAHFDLAAAALIGGLTNVVTLASGVGDPYFSVKFTGLGVNFGKHGIGHGGNYNGWTWEDMSIMIRRFHFDLIARLMTKLQAVPEGDGTLLDRTTIVYLSDAAEGHHSRCWEWPMVTIGNFGGAIKAGRYIELLGHGAKNHKHIGNMYTTLLNAAGNKAESFGQPDPILGKDVDQKGGIAELLV